MRIFFIGSVEFSSKALTMLINMDCEIVGVAAAKNTGLNADYVDLGQICEVNNILYKYIDEINDLQVHQWIEGLVPDVIYCFGWSRLLKEPILSMVPLGVVGFHPAALPENRGRHPLIWALALGLSQTASTFFIMDDGADSGDILSQEYIDIDYNDDARTLYDKITSEALRQLEKINNMLSSREFARIPQDHSMANIWRKRGAKDGQIDFRMNSYTIYNLVRALAKPYIGAHVQQGDNSIKVWKVKEISIDGKNIEPGKVLTNTNDTFTVKVTDGAVEVIEHEFEHIPEIGTYL